MKGWLMDFLLTCLAVMVGLILFRLIEPLISGIFPKK